MRAALRKAAREKPELSAAISGLLAGAFAEPPKDLEVAAQREDQVLLTLIRALPFPERMNLERAAKGASDGSSPRARKISRRFHRSALARQKLGLSFW